MIVNYDSVFNGDILIEKDKILKVGNNLEDTYAKVIDAEGNYVFPGFIDAHTHPGLPEDLGYHKSTNDFYTETKAAFVGGTTTIFDFAEQKKGERLIDALNGRKKRYEGLACCRYNFHVAVTNVTNDIYEQMKEIKSAGVNSIKIYSTYDMKLSNNEIIKVMNAASKLDIIVLVHCEDDSIINFCKDRENFEDKRPIEAELNMIYTIINFSKITNAKIYICHVSCKESVELIKKAKKEGVNIYLETCPQYLLLNKSKYHIKNYDNTIEALKERTKFTLSPPLRNTCDNEALVKACLDGAVDLISTDHCAFLFKNHKSIFYSDIDKAAKGIPGIQLRPSLIYQKLVIDNNLRIEDFVKLLSYNPAQILNIKNRGYIKEGYSSDLVIWNEDYFKVSIEKIIEGCDFSPYEGLTLTGKPKYVNLFL